MFGSLQGLRRQSDGLVMNKFAFNRGQFTHSPLSALLTIGSLDPVHDRCPQPRSRDPATSAEDVLL